MIAFLCRFPIRLTNLQEIEIGNQLQLHDSNWVLSFKAESMKAGKVVTVNLPKELVRPLEYYLDTIRPIMAKNCRDTAALWLSTHNTKMRESSIYTALSKRVREELCLHVTPHDFRHIVASHLSEDHPDQTRIAAPLLQQSTFKTTETNYIRGQRHKAARKYNDAVENLTTHTTEIDQPTSPSLELYLERNLPE